MVPNYGSRSEVSWSTSNVQSDGYIIAYCQTNGHTNPSYVNIDNNRQIIISGCNSAYGTSSITIPVQSGHNITCYDGTVNSKGAYLIQFKNNEIMNLPNYNDPKIRLTGTSYTENCNGWLYACAISTANSNQSYIRINGGAPDIYYTYSNSCTVVGSAFIPISSSDNYIIYNNAYPISFLFFPCKETSQAGFPDWGNEKALSWNQEYVAEEPGWIYAQCISYCCNSNSPEYTPGYLTVNSTVFVISQGGETYMNSSLFLPISKGDKYCTSGGNTSKSLYFYPFIKNNE